MERVLIGRKKILEDEGLLVLKRTFELVRSTLESKPNLTRVCIEKYGRYL